MRENPEFCTNEECELRDPKEVLRQNVRWRREGFFEGKQRFKCPRCGRRFTHRSFGLNYWYKNKDSGLSAKIFHLFQLGSSNRAIARHCGVSEHCVRLRLERMSQWALLFHSMQMSQGTIKEAVAVDGLENFAASQYEPNNINQAIGRDSLFIYDFNFVGLNRKGRMSARQRIRLDYYHKTKGCFDRAGIRVSFGELVKRLVAKKDASLPVLTLLSDEHFQYRRAVHYDLKREPIEHVTISSKATRNYQNILFSVNHADLLIRQAVGAFSRETISFAKTHARMCQKYVLFMIAKNYMLAQFTKKQVRRPRAHEQSPAQAVGLVDRMLKFRDIFGRKPPMPKGQMSEDWLGIYEGRILDKYLRSKEFLRGAVA